MIEYRCVCGRILIALESQRGQSVPCPSCGHVTRLPSGPARVSPVRVALVLGGILVCLFWLLVPALFRPGREGSSVRMLESNNLRQFGLAMHAYESCFGEFPRAAICSPDGKPLLSWRVAILPFIEQDGLYRRFRLGEPWDSPHNLKLLPLIPKIYRSVQGTAADPPGATPYQAVVGKGMLFDLRHTNRAGKLVGRRLDEVPDGLSDTLLLVVAKTPVPWTKPQDIDADDGLLIGPRLDPRWGGRPQILLADGSVRSVQLPLPEATWRAVLTAAGGELLAADWHTK